MAYLPAVIVAAGIAFVSLWENPQTAFSLQVNDKFVHALMYAVLTIALLIPNMVSKRFAWHSYLTAGLTAFVYGGVMELLQAYCTATRTAEWADMLADGAGVVIALVLVERIRNRLSVEK